MGVKFNPFTSKLDVVDSPDGDFDSIDVSGDITLDDGGTYTTTVQTVTPTANRTISFPDATGTVALVAGSSGQLTYNDAGAQAGLTSANIGSTGEINVSLAGAASTPPVTFTGSWFTGGTATTTKPQLLIEPSGTTSTAWSTSGTGLGVNAASGFAGRLLDLQINGTSRMVIQGDGKVGIGTQTPTGALTINADGDATQLIIKRATTAEDNGLQLQSQLGTTVAFFNVEGANTNRLQIGGSNEIAFFTSSAFGSPPTNERARITGDGKVGIGTSSPAHSLHVAGITRVGADDTSDAVLEIGGGATGNRNAFIDFVSDTTYTDYGLRIIRDNTGENANSYIAHRGNGGLNFLCEDSGPVVFSSGVTERMRITSDAYVRLASGTGGIQFNGDTAAANALDDYEEGTWTPVIVGQTTAGTGTYSTQLGRYIKVGSHIHCTGTLIWTAHDGTGNMRIEGLPFSSLNVSELFHAAVFAYVANITMPADSILMGDMPNNTSRITLRSVVTGGGTPSPLGMDSAGNIYFSITYQTN